MNSEEIAKTAVLAFVRGQPLADVELIQGDDEGTIHPRVTFTFANGFRIVVLDDMGTLVVAITNPLLTTPATADIERHDFHTPSGELQ